MEISHRSSRGDQGSPSAFLPLLSPAIFWLVGFVLIPLSLVFVYSFCQRGASGELVWAFTLRNYVQAFDVTYLLPILRSLWMVLLREGGVINTVLLWLGVIKEPLKLLFTEKAVFIGLVYGYLPFMVLPVYASIEKLDTSLVEAAYDLGANSFQAFFRVILPLTTPGIAAGAILVFVPSLGAFVTPDLLGGAKSMMLGNLINHQYLKVRNWPFGSALSFLLICIVMAFLWVYA